MQNLGFNYSTVLPKAANTIETKSEEMPNSLKGRKSFNKPSNKKIKIFLIICTRRRLVFATSIISIWKDDIKFQQRSLATKEKQQKTINRDNYGRMIWWNHRQISQYH